MSSFSCRLVDLFNQVDEFDALSPREIPGYLGKVLPKQSEIDRISKLVFEATEPLCVGKERISQRDTGQLCSKQKQRAFGSYFWKSLPAIIEKRVKDEVRKNEGNSKSERAISVLARERIKIAAADAVKYCVTERKLIKDLLYFLKAKELGYLVLEAYHHALESTGGSSCDDYRFVEITSASCMMLNLFIQKIDKHLKPTSIRFGIENAREVHQLIVEVEQVISSEESLAQDGKQLLVTVVAAIMRVSTESVTNIAQSAAKDCKSLRDHHFFNAFPLTQFIEIGTVNYVNIVATELRDSKMNPIAITLFDRLFWQFALYSYELLSLLRDQEYVIYQEIFFRKYCVFDEKPQKSILPQLTEEEIEQLIRESQPMKRATPKKKKQLVAAKKPAPSDEGSSSTHVETVQTVSLSKIENSLKDCMAKFFQEDRRVTRWFRIKDLLEIKSFSDRGELNYSQIEDRELLERKRRLHAFPPIEKAYFDEELRKTYCEEVKNGFKMIGYMEWPGLDGKVKRAYGSIEIGLDDRGRVVHRYLKPSSNKDISFEQLIGGEVTIGGDPFEQELQDNEILFSDAIVKVSDQKILSVHHGDCSIFALPILTHFDP